MANANYTATIGAKSSTVEQNKKLANLLLGKIGTESAKAIKYLSVSNNTISFWKDENHTGTADFTVDFPTEYFLDQVKTQFVQSFEFNDTAGAEPVSNYPGATNPNLEGKPVMVLAVKGTDNSVAYSFIDMSALGATGDTVTVTTEGSGVIQINGTGKTVVNIATDTEYDEMLKDLGLIASA